VWRQLDAIGLNLPLMKNPQAFARAHVEQFLRGAAVRTLGRVVGKRGNARAPSSRRSKTRPVHARVDGQPER
jgi:hypothetical protein